MIRFKLIGPKPIRMKVDDAVQVDTGGGGYVEPYPGPYEATPKVTEQVLATKNKRMAEDVTIYEIPYHETSNQSGGYTAIIGGV